MKRWFIFKCIIVFIIRHSSLRRLEDYKTLLSSITFSNVFTPEEYILMSSFES